MNIGKTMSDLQRLIVIAIVALSFFTLAKTSKAESYYYPPQITPLDPDVNYCLLAGVALDAGATVYEDTKIPVIGDSVILESYHMDIINMVVLYMLGCIGNLAEAHSDNDTALFFSYVQQLSEISQ